MPRIRQAFVAPVLVVALLFAAACGAKSPTSPTTAQPGGGDSQTPAPAPSPAGTATIAGQVVAGAVALDASSSAPLAGVTVTISGTSINAVADGNGRFSLSNVPGGDQQIEFNGNGAAHAHVTIEHVAEQEKIEVTVAVTGGNAQVMEQERVTGAQAQLEGTITAKSESARTLEVHGVTVKVPSGVPIRHGSKTLTFANLHTGDRVHVKGSKDGNAITATEVDVQQGEDTPGNGNGDDHGGNGNGNGNDDNGEHENEVELNGTPSGMSGTCPNLTFTLQGKTVTTDQNTEFRKGTCDEFKAATNVEAEGTLTGTTVAAKKVSIEKD